MRLARELAPLKKIEFRRGLTDQQLAESYRSAKALVFAAEEDFGMVPVEAQAAGCPVICYGKGGALETVYSDANQPTGLFFNELSEECLSAVIEEFILRQEDFTPDNCITQAYLFGESRFRHEFVEALDAIGFSLPSEDTATGIDTPFHEPSALRVGE
jgi:glycosyltransferase involved in cell wall biosynthesis